MTLASSKNNFRRFGYTFRGVEFVSADPSRVLIFHAEYTTRRTLARQHLFNPCPAGIIPRNQIGPPILIRDVGLPDILVLQYLGDEGCGASILPYTHRMCEYPNEERTGCHIQCKQVRQFQVREDLIYRMVDKVQQDMIWDMCQS